MNEANRYVRVVEFDVFGTPVPQGSKSAFAFKDKQTGRLRASVTDKAAHGNGPSVSAWRAQIATRARQWVEDNAAPAPFDCAVGVVLTFFVVRPASTPKRVVYPIRKPDLDKLVRAVLDGITSIIIIDDARVVELVARKRFATTIPFVRIMVQAL